MYLISAVICASKPLPDFPPCEAFMLPLHSISLFDLAVMSLNSELCPVFCKQPFFFLFFRLNKPVFQSAVMFILTLNLNHSSCVTLQLDFLTPEVTYFDQVDINYVLMRKGGHKH